MCATRNDTTRDPETRQPATLLRALTKLSNELDAGKPAKQVRLQNELLGHLVELYKAQLKYEQLRNAGSIDPIEFFELGQPRLDEAAAKTFIQPSLCIKLVQKRLPPERGI